MSENEFPEEDTLSDVTDEMPLPPIQASVVSSKLINEKVFMPVKLSVCVSGVPNRLASGPPSLLNLLAQAEGKPVEILFFLDNKKRPVGDKRTNLLQLAKGEYVSACDDDDNVAPNYIDELLAALDENAGVDVVLFTTRVTIDGGNEGLVYPDIHQPEQEPYVPGGITKRRPIQIACWRRELVQDIAFPSVQFGEDHAWGDLASARAKTQVLIDKPLYHYNFNTKTTEASPGGL